MHAWRYPAHERVVGAIARDLGFAQVSESHAASALIKLVGRGDTTVVDAYLSPILARYVGQVSRDLDVERTGARVMFMMSSGGLTSAKLFAGKDAILSGPAGGVVAMARTGASAGFRRVIGFDMGGTSTDVAHFDGEFERAFETEVAGVRMRAPMMKIHTVAAGGGSILTFDGARFRVGPASAGADPGPAAYRRGGPLAVTDANLMTGKLIPDLFPKVFGPRGDEPLDAAVVRERFAALAREIGDGRSEEAVADGFLAIAVAKMAEAIKTISVARGYDVTRYALNCFGGAGGQHACDVADALAITTVLIHPFSSLLSAYGMGLADIAAQRGQGVDEPLDAAALARVGLIVDRLADAAVAEVMSQGVAREAIKVHARAQLRYAGSDTTIEITLATPAAMRRAFERAHKSRFGFIDRAKAIAIEAVSVEATGGAARLIERARAPNPSHKAGGDARPARATRFFSHGAWRKANVYLRETLPVGAAVDGPALVIEPHQTIVVEHGWRAAITAKNHVLLTRVEPIARREAIGAKADPVMLEIFNHLFMSIAEQMGVTLQNTAYSVNIKERLDFSCAVFDREGRLVANAPHMPVHLGSMDRSVETIIRDNQGRIRPGDVFALNAPYNGGTHLPDITVCTPVFDEEAKTILFWTASRGHHADIGGTAPGSMSPLATTIQEEGVYIDNFLLLDRGRFRERELYELLASGPWPARNPLQNVNDLKAQIAANEKGARELKRMVEMFSLRTVEAYMGHVQDNADESVRRVIDRLADGEATSVSDQGAVIKVRISVDKAQARGDRRFHRHVAAAADELQRARAGDARRRALRVPGDGRRRHPDQRRVPTADPGRPARRLDAEPALSRRRGGGQCRGVAGGDRHAVRRARRAWVGAGHDEQPHLRRRHLSILRDDLLRRARRPRLRRRGGGAYAHDQFAPDRPGGAREPVSGRARGFPHPPRLRRKRPMARGRRHAETHPLSAPDERGDPQRPPRRRQSGRDGRRAGRAWPQLGPPQRRTDRNPARLRRDLCRSGRSDRDRDADGRGVGEGRLTSTHPLLPRGEGSGMRGRAVAMTRRSSSPHPSPSATPSPQGRREVPHFPFIVQVTS